MKELGFIFYFWKHATWKTPKEKLVILYRLYQKNFKRLLIRWYQRKR